MHKKLVPYTKIFVNDSLSVALCADGHINILNSETGSVLISSLSSEEGKRIDKSGPLVSAAVDESFRLLVTASSDKSIRTWEIESLRLVSEREAPKKPTGVSFTRDAQTVLVADKFGDVHSYPVYVSRESAQTSATVASSSDSSKPTTTTALCINGGSLLLGHVSVLTAHLLSRDEKFIITADRDEHVRVSWYPEAYIIEAYCLGHKAFVSALHIPQWNPSHLISGGGDPTLRIWNWMEGKVLREIDIKDVVIPYVKVTREKLRHGDDNRSDREGEVEDDDESKLSSRRRRKLRKKGKSKGKGIDERSPSEAMDVDEKEDKQGISGAEKIEFDSREVKEREPLLAVQKIAAVQCGSNRFVVFSAHGATALFYCDYPELSDAVTSTPTPSHIHCVPLDKPTLDFTIWPNSNEIWVVVDALWSTDMASSETAPEFVRAVKVVGNELHASKDSMHQSLITALNRGVHEASPGAMKQVDMYAALAMLPKNIDAEYNAMDDDVALSEASKGRQLSHKELGRLKSKKAVLVLHTAVSSAQDDVCTEEREPKRQKSFDT